MEKTHLRRRAIDAVTMFLVSALSLLLLIYIGLGEAQRTYYQFHVDKVVAQARTIQNAMESYLQAGLPLKQFVGFSTLAEPIVESDPSIDAMSVFDQSGRRIFVNGQNPIGRLLGRAGESGNPDQSYEIFQSDLHYQVVLPLRNKFEIVGQLAVTVPKDIVAKSLESSFQPLLIAAIVLSLAFTVFTTIIGPRMSGWRSSWLHIAYAVTFLAMSVMVVSTLVSLYSEGAQAKTKALANSLGERVNDIFEFNLHINDIEGLDRAFAEYRHLNPDISAVGLLLNGKVLIHTNPQVVGQHWINDGHTFEYFVDLVPKGNLTRIQLAVVLPVGVVYRQVFRSVKNFTALFVASAFLAGLFLQVAGVANRKRRSEFST
ncbi:MAG: hypothetical protein HY246_22485, partial [Proteobacteria bacterium]|nr:hypothetical protein [Pseudomonadota bacterium]